MSTLDQQVAAMRKDGCVIIENAFSEEFCDAVTAAMARIAKDHDIKPMDMDFSGRNTIRIMNLLQYDELFQQIPVCDAFLPIIEQYLDPECLLSSMSASMPGPGEKAQPLHADTWWIDDRRFDFPVMVNTIIALNDFTGENGATRFVPGSHLWSEEDVAYDTPDASYGQVPASQPKGYMTEWQPIVAEMSKGSVLVYDFKLLHGQGENRTGAPQPRIIMPYILGWMRQLDAFHYALPPEKLKSFPPRLRKLIGLESYRLNYGNVNHKSPAEWMWGREEREPDALGG
ncbi:phytanoyl-CoA dioxygenase family protein [Novosphingobium malaysiense]|uniref:Phytanoyl-CoA dioxygenase n=1 Tax=Novosphingobium malaysiense TaxID=1348853 RepID=A0A0B1ZID8_9SPHN|nr:phytanoyl-CoA dioxygenase family protein [Novosphingobium malaysiense]KHK89082.1 hypothetical protein LK12_22360 [Novosphingobium malaysiense]